MPTMTIKQEIEVTPDIAKTHLSAFAVAGSANSFPHPKGTWLHVSPDFLKQIGAIPDLPALVLTDASGTPLGCVGVCGPNGISIGFVMKEQVIGLWTDEAPVATPASSAT